MTNDELNRWYHEHLGKCVHRWERWNDGGGAWWQCQNCPANVDGTFNPSTVHPFPDYLSDPAVIQGIIKEQKIALCHGRHHKFKCYVWVASSVGFDSNRRLLYLEGDEFLERAVMLALKAKVEQKEKAVA